MEGKNRVIKVGYITPDDREEWNRMLLNFAEVRLCHVYDWYEILPKVYDYKPIYLTVKEDGNLIGLFPSFIINSKLFGNRLVSMPFTSYGGPLFRKYSRIANEKLLSRIISIARSNHLEYIEIRTPTNHFEKQMRESNFVENTNYNYCSFLVDLRRDSKDILASFRKSTRRGIRIAERRGVSIKECQKEGDLKAFNDLYLMTMKKHGTPPHSFQFFKENWNHFYPDHLRIFFATYESRIISTMLFYVFDKEIKYTYGASLNEKKYLRLCPNDLLVWHAIRFGKQRDLDILNLGRTRPSTGVYFFKEGWGAIKVPLRYFCRLSNTGKLPYLDPHSPKYNFISKIWKMLPDFATRRLGPKIMGGTGG